MLVKNSVQRYYLFSNCQINRSFSLFFSNVMAKVVANILLRKFRRRICPVRWLGDVSWNFIFRSWRMVTCRGKGMLGFLFMKTVTESVMWDGWGWLFAVPEGAKLCAPRYICYGEMWGEAFVDYGLVFCLTRVICINSRVGMRVAAWTVCFNICVAYAECCFTVAGFDYPWSEFDVTDICGLCPKIS